MSLASEGATQGNRVKESCCDKAGKEVIVPRGDFALEAEAVLSGRPADQVEGHVLGGVQSSGGPGREPARAADRDIPAGVRSAWIGRSHATAMTINRLTKREAGAMIDR